MEVHVLNGDALAAIFHLPGEIIICREAMIDGPADAGTEEEFWFQRSEFTTGEYNASREEYDRLVVAEINKLKQIKPDTITLWFEHDLFCQTNLWFVIDFITRYQPTLRMYRAMPDPDRDTNWSGFGKMDTADLHSCYMNRTLLDSNEKQLAMSLWRAYRHDDRKTLKELSVSHSHCFPKLEEVCKAHLDRASEIGRPQQKLKSIVRAGTTNFDQIFDEFRKTEGIYGFGDLQVKKLLGELTF